MEILLSHPFFRSGANTSDEKALFTFIKDQLKSCGNQLLQNRAGSNDDVILDDEISSHKLCFLIECIFQHEMKDKIASNRGFWDIIEKLPECLPGIDHIIKLIKEQSKNLIARGRIFVRVSLNEGLLFDMLSSLSWNQDLVRQYYKEDSFLLNDDGMNDILTILETLKPLRFALFFNDKDFDQPKYWNNFSIEVSPKIEGTPIPHSEPVPISPPVEQTSSKPITENIVETNNSVTSNSITSNSANDPSFLKSSIDLSKSYEGTSASSLTSNDILVDRKMKKKPKSKNRRVIEMVNIDEADENPSEASRVTKTNKIPNNAEAGTKTISRDPSLEILPTSTPAPTPTLVEDSATDLVKENPILNENVEVEPSKEPSCEIPIDDETQNLEDEIDKLALEIEEFPEINITPSEVNSPEIKSLEILQNSENVEIEPVTTSLASRDSPEVVLKKDEEVHPTFTSFKTSPNTSLYSYDRPKDNNDGEYHPLPLFQQLLNYDESSQSSISSYSNSEESSLSSYASPSLQPRSSLTKNPMSFENLVALNVLNSRPNPYALLPDMEQAAVPKRETPEFIGSFSMIDDYSKDEQDWDRSAPTETTKPTVKSFRDEKPSAEIEEQNDEVQSLIVGNFVLEVPEKPLFGQGNKKCFGCNAVLPTGIFSYTPWCYYSGRYYCKNCHKGDKAIIPARVISNWDKKEYPVCKTAYTHILTNYATPLINIGIINPQLYDWDSSLNQIRKLRHQLGYLGEFIRTCRSSSKLLELIGDKEYIMNSIHIYSLRDLVECKQLLQFLYDVMEKYIVHVTKTCETCRGKGYYCEICNSQELIFSFQFSTTIKCPVCFAIFHRACLNLKKEEERSFVCPKCERIKMIKDKGGTRSSKILTNL